MPTFFKGLIAGFVLASMCAVWDSDAATKYVAQGGAAAWAACTTPTTPCSMSTAQTNAAAGDTVCAYGTLTSGINTATAGTTAARIVLDGRCDGVPEPARVDNTGSNFNFVTIDQPYWTIRNFYFGRMNLANDAFALVGVSPGGDYSIIERNEFDGFDTSVSQGYMGILGNLNNGTTSVTGVVVRDNTFRRFGQDAARFVPRNAVGGCTAGIGKFIDLQFLRNTFVDVRTSLRTANPYASEAELTTCMDGRPLGLLFDYNNVDGTTANGVNFDCQFGALCRVGWNTFTRNGKGVSDTYNVIQTGKADGGYIVGNRVYGVDDLGGAGDGSGIIADHGGVYRSLQSQRLTIAGNLVVDADANSEACGVMVWSADDTRVFGNVLARNLNNVCVANSDVTGTSVFGNTMVNPVLENVEYSASAAASTLTNNLLIGGVNAVNIESPSTAPTDANNDMHGFTGVRVGGNGTYTPAGSTIDVDPLFIGGRNGENPIGFRPTAAAVCTGAVAAVGATWDGQRFRQGGQLGALACRSLRSGAGRAVLQ